MSRLLRSVVAIGLSASAAHLPAQATVLPVTSTDPAALEAAIVAANGLAFQTSPSQPVVIEFANALIGQTVFLTQALPILVVDHVTMRVAGAGPAARVTIDASGTTTAMRITSHHAVVRNLRFQNAGAPGSQEDVFTAFGCDDLTLADCDFDGATGNSLWLIGCTSVAVRDSGFRFGAAGLVATGGTQGLVVERCTFANNQQAMLFAVTNLATIRDCVFDTNGKGFVMQPICADVTFGPGNVVRSGGGWPGLVAAGAVRLRVESCHFHDNQQAAIQLRDLCADVIVRGNTLERNGLADNTPQVRIDNALGVQIEGLSCRDGGSGVHAENVRYLSISGTSAAPTTIAENRLQGIVLANCTDSVLNQVTVRDNVRTIAGEQVGVLGCERIDVIGCTVDAAPGAGDIGVRVANSDLVRVGGGTSVLDLGAIGVLIDGSDDTVLGTWPGVTGSLAVRANTPLQVNGSARVQVAGTAAAPCSLSAGTIGTALACAIAQSDAFAIGPHVSIDGRGLATTALQVANSNGVRVVGVTVQGHAGFGIVGTGAPGLEVRSCIVDGAANGPAATGEGVLLNPGCHGGGLLGNLVRRHQGSAFVVRDSDDVWIGPGNRAIDNGGDGFVATDSGSGAPVRRITIQSSVAIGRGLSGQSGVRCVHVRANLTNVTATRNGTGVLLQLGSVATLVNTISWGNGLDRNRDPASSGTWRHGLRGNSAGNGSPGTWSEQDMLLGVDPQFVDVASGDARLGAGSPAIDNGLHATPTGTTVPCADAGLGQRVRGGTVDRGAYESASSAPNTLDVAGPWLRDPAAGTLTFTVRATTAQTGNPFLLFLSGSGTGPGAIAPGGSSVPIVPDPLTGLLLTMPGWCLGTIGPTGSGSVTVPLPPEVTPLLPELTFAAVTAGVAPATNPVIVRFLR